MLAAATATLIVAAARRARRRTPNVDGDQPADVGFMRAIHAAFRRDLVRLEAAAPDVERLGRAHDQVLAGWSAFRDALTTHHTAEDDDLWPVLRTHLTDETDRSEVDAMVAEHRDIPAALDEVDTALSRATKVTSAADALAAVVHRHLEHEERSILPLLERHLSRKEWRAFLLTERARRSARERPQWLAWVLDDAGERDAAAVLAELPRPAHLVYRWAIRPRYEAEHRWQADPSTQHDSVPGTAH